MKNRGQRGKSFFQHWLGGDGTCIEITSTTALYNRIERVDTRHCEAIGTAVKSPGNPTAIRTVCGVILKEKKVRYLCEVEENRQATTRLRMPDANISLEWKPEGKVEFRQDGVAPVEAKFSEAEGEMNIILNHRTFFYISDPEAAALEVKNFQAPE